MGTKECTGRNGYRDDAQKWNRWGVDFVAAKACSAPADPVLKGAAIDTQLGLARLALDATGRKIMLSGQDLPIGWSTS